MSVRLLAVGILCASAAACTTAPKGPAWTPTKISGGHNPIAMTPDLVQMVKVGVTKRLKDPGSVQFGEMIGTADASDPELVTVCGLVNAKNSFGGYTGMQPYYGMLLRRPGGGFGVMQFGSDDIKAGAVRDVCSQSGIALPIAG